MNVLAGILSIAIGCFAFYLKKKYPEAKNSAILTNLRFVIGGISFIIIGILLIIGQLKLFK